LGIFENIFFPLFSRIFEKVGLKVSGRMIFNTPRHALTITEANFLDNGGGLARILPVTS
jgi:hypothetical protein